MRYVLFISILIFILVAGFVQASAPIKCAICHRHFKEGDYVVCKIVGGKPVQVCFKHGFDDAMTKRFSELRKK